MYQQAHQDVRVDINDQNANSKELRGKIGHEWIDLYADLFKEYAEDHLDKPLSPDPSELDELAISFKEFYEKREKITLH